MDDIRKCVIDYIAKGNPCPCHPTESAIVIPIVKDAIQHVIRKCANKILRELIDDQIVLNEEIIS